MIRVLLAGVFGFVLGSFLNVVIHRVPRGGSIVTPGSACPKCGKALAPRDNIPVLSYLVLRGRCRFCSTRISLRYPAIELVNAVIWVGAMLRFASTETAIFVAAAGSVLIVLATIDLEHRRVPNVIVLPSTGGAIVWLVVVSAVSQRWDILSEALLGAFGSFLVLFVIATVSGGMGFGDVKLAAFTGVVAGRFGWEVAFIAMLVGFFCGGIVGLVLLATRRVGRKSALPFAPALAAGALVAVFGNQSLSRWWLG